MLYQSSCVVTFHSGQIWGEQRSRTPPARPATSTLTDGSSDSGPKGFVVEWNWDECMEKKKYSIGGKSKKGADHEVFATEDDPETEERWVEDALLNVLKQQHPGPLGAQGEPLHWYVQEHHGDAQSKNHPVQGEWVTLKKNWLLKDQQLCAAGTVSTWFQQADFALWIEHFSFPLLSTWPPEALRAS